MSDAARRLAQVEQLFAAAKELPAAERAAWLSQRCAGDAALRREVAQLLAHHEHGGTLLDTSAGAWLERGLER
jgi:hypothetical protein